MRSVLLLPFINEKIRALRIKYQYILLHLSHARALQCSAYSSGFEIKSALPGFSTYQLFDFGQIHPLSFFICKFSTAEYLLDREDVRKVAGPKFKACRDIKMILTS